ncbi:MAG TPA: hypothetical protein VGM52_08190 [Herbaspirillum sp.]
MVIALALGINIFQPSKDSANKTPYIVYAASYEKSKALIDLGLDTVAPETKLGFHTDGTIVDAGISMPHNIMLYNIVIEYLKGAHARDVFEEPIPGVPYTRVFMRFTDARTIDLNG